MELRTLDEIKLVCSNIAYKDWSLEIQDIVRGFLIKWVFLEKDLTNPNDPNLYKQECREWFISRACTDTQIIRTVYLALKQAIDHELNEQFLYCGVRIFDPHADYLKLTEFMSKDIKDQVD